MNGLDKIKNEFLLAILILFLIVLSFLYPSNIIQYPKFIEWNTIFLIAALLILTYGIKESGYFYVLSEKMARKIKNERNLAFFMIAIATLLSTFLTNDVTLFIIIPFSLSFKDLIEKDVFKLLAFETIAVNAGSSLTPIGNPQNIFIWQKWGASFIQFIFKMFPLFLILVAILMIFLFITFPNKRLLPPKKFNKNLDKGLFSISIFLLILFIALANFGFVFYSFILIFLFYLIFYPKVIYKMDWPLILLFILIFIDFTSLSKIPIIQNAVSSIEMNGKNVFLLSSFLSQIMSNVPAAVFISQFSNNWRAIVYGVNIGGNGIIFSSLANLITIRLAKEKELWLIFHKYSILYFLITLIISLLLFFK